MKRGHADPILALLPVLKLGSWIDPPILIPHIASVALQPKNLTLNEVDFLEMDGGARIPNLDGITLLQNLASLDVQ